MTKHGYGCKCNDNDLDMDETKEHILSAGRELMLAADGALRFCKCYAQQAASPQARSQLVSFFTKAISVADELAKGLIAASGKEAVRKAAAPLFDALGEEMAKESRIAKRKAGPPKGRPARRKKAVKRPVVKSSRGRSAKRSRKV